MPYGAILGPHGSLEDCQLRVTGSGQSAVRLLADARQIRGGVLLGNGAGKSILASVEPLTMWRKGTGYEEVTVASPACFPATKAVGDMFMIWIPNEAVAALDATTPPDVTAITFDIATAAVWVDGTGYQWRYSATGSTWVALTVGSDGTKAANGPLEQDGTLVFTNPGAAWKPVMFNSILGFVIVLAITADKLTTIPTLNALPTITVNAGRTHKGILVAGNLGLGAGLTNLVTTPADGGCVWDTYVE
jgi:hypothetical protein